MLVTLSGCSSMKIMHQPFVATDAKFTEELVKTLDMKEGIKGEDCTYIFILPLGSPPTVDGAIQDALKKAPGAVGLYNVQVRQTAMTALIYAKMCVKVAGAPLYKK